MPQWKDVDVNFRGSSSALGDAMQQVAAAASIPGQTLKDREAQKRYEAELARQKVLDDRAATLFAQQQEDRAQQKAIRQGVLDTEQALALAAPYAKDVAAFEDPRYKDALAAWQSKYGPNADITESAKILSSYLQEPKNTEIVRSGTGGNILPAVEDRIGTKGAIGKGERIPIRTEITGGNSIMNKEGFIRPEATVQFGETKEGTKSGIKDVRKTYANPKFQERSPVEGDGSIIQMKTNRFGSRYPSLSIGNVGNKLADILPFTHSVINAAGHAIAGDKNTIDYADVIKNPGDYKPEAIREAVLNTPGMYKNRPASSVRYPNEKGQALLDAYKPSATPSQRKEYTAKISEINMSKMFNQDRTPIDTKNGGVSKTGDVYFKTKEGQLVNALTLGKAMQDNFVPANSVQVGTTPIKEKVVYANTSDIAQGAPVFSTSAEYVRSVAQKNSIPVERVTGTMNAVGDMYKSALAMLGTDNTAERNALRQMAQSQAAQSGLTSKDFDVKGYVDTVLPSNDLTQRQAQALNIVLKQIDDFRQDKRWAQEDKWKEMEMAFKEKQFEWSKMMDKAGLSLKQQALAAEKSKASMKVPEGYILDPRYAPEGYVSKDAYLQGLKRSARTPEEIKKEQLEIKKLEKELNPGFSLFSPSTW